MLIGNESRKFCVLQVHQNGERVFSCFSYVDEHPLFPADCFWKRFSMMVSRCWIPKTGHDNPELNVYCTSVLVASVHKTQRRKSGFFINASDVGFIWTLWRNYCRVSSFAAAGLQNLQLADLPQPTQTAIPAKWLPGITATKNIHYRQRDAATCLPFRGKLSRQIRGEIEKKSFLTNVNQDRFHLITVHVGPFFGSKDKGSSKGLFRLAPG